MRRSIICCAALVVLASVPSTGVLAGDVHVGINIGVPPPPPVVFEAPPQLVVVPTTPAVRYAPEVDVNLFFYGGRYYSFHEGGWFVAPAYGGPWAYVERVRVPRPVLVVPARYYRVPPGQWKKMYPDRRGKHRGHRDWDDDDDHGHDHGHGHGRGHGHHDDD